jgi:hypothetical protein
MSNSYSCVVDYFDNFHWTFPLYKISLAPVLDLFEIIVFKYETQRIKYKLFGILSYYRNERVLNNNGIYQCQFDNLKDAYKRYIEIRDQINDGNMSCLYDSDNMLIKKQF